MPHDVAANLRAHVDAVRSAGTRLVVFPELSLTGYDLTVAPVGLDALDPLVVACAASGAVALVGAPVDGAIAAVLVSGEGAQVVYRKQHLHGPEVEHFTAGDGPRAIEVDGVRIGLGICRDTGEPQHLADVAALDVDLYAAGVVHAPHELAEQDRRGEAIARTCDAFTVIASAAGPVGPDYPATAGTSTIWAPDGSVASRAGAEPGELVRLGRPAAPAPR